MRCSGVRFARYGDDLRSRRRGRVGGALFTEIYSVGPLTATRGLNITVWSYVDQFNISVIAEGATVDDPHEVTDAKDEKRWDISP